MAKKKQRTCIVCRGKYSYCPVCGEDRNKPTWYAVCCSEECHTVLKAIADYTNKVISKEEASEILSQIDKAKLDTMCVYTDSINEIIGKKSKKKTSTVEKTEAAEKVVVEEILTTDET